ncbi:hypothetical protein B0H19DRAFT_1134473, partial [Mycena capillaripes]
RAPGAEVLIPILPARAGVALPGPLVLQGHILIGPMGVMYAASVEAHAKSGVRDTAGTVVKLMGFPC